MTYHLFMHAFDHHVGLTRGYGGQRLLSGIPLGSLKKTFRLNEYSHSRHPITLPINCGTMSVAWEPIQAMCYDVL